MSMKRKHTARKVGSAAAAMLGVTALAFVPGVAAAGQKAAGKYVTGDFHNHTTCSDGSLSIQKLVDKSAGTFGLDWFIQVGHGGSSSRNCTLAEDPFEPVAPALGLTVPPTIPAGGQPASDLKGPNQTWSSTVGNAAIKGDPIGSATARGMWKWQEIQDFMYPVMEQEARNRNKPIFMGLEQVVPGHEHSSTSVIDGQLPAVGNGNASALAMFEYCFDRADGDTSRGGFVGGAGNNWDCSVPGSANNGLLDATARKNLNNSGVAGHLKTIEGVKWMGAFFADTSFNIPAHVERAGAFNPAGSNGYNVEHFRDYNNAGPTVAFGFESMPGHQPIPNGRGGYGRGAVGGGTVGGSGVYAGLVGGVWDALLGEGRNWFFFASSDYHNRGAFGPDQRETTGDFYPGEYSRDYVMVRNGSGPLTPKGVVDGLRSGNSFVANGGVIDRLAFIACASYPGIGARTNAAVEALAARSAANNTDIDVAGCATMGEKLVVRPGADVVVSIVVRDPVGKNYSPYSFPNPSLMQIGMVQPLDSPVLDHIDVISGLVTGYVTPGSVGYSGLLGSPAATNPSAAVSRTFNSSNWTALADGTRKMTFRVPAVRASQYVRLRGTNIPPATPFESDATGNPLNDLDLEGKVPCADAACPAHMNTVDGVKYMTADVSAWADLWFYSNPIFVEVKGSTAVAGIK